MRQNLRNIVKALTWGVVTTWASTASAQIRIVDEPDPLLANLSIPTNAAERGLWSPTAAWPIVGLHAALTPSGTVLTYGAPPGRAVQDGRTFAIWDPGKGLGASAHTVLPNAQFIDSFCAAATTMITGSMLISGGSSTDSGYSSLASTTFDPSRQTPTALASQLALPRWYGTMITLADGRPLMVGGGKPYVVDAYKGVSGALAGNDVSMVPEVYVAGSGWRTLPGAASRDAFGPDFNRWWYPRLWVAPSGKVFGVSSERMWTLDPAGNGAIVTAPFKTAANPNTRPNIGPTSTAVMYDQGRILQVGGNGYANGYASPSSAAATVFDIGGTTPQTRETAAMANPRQWANATVLPNGRVLVTGGTRYADNAGRDAVYAAESWNPATGAWTTLASAANYRGYHSAAILLQNGTVLTTGGGVPGPVNNLNAEVYYPPYLFRSSNGRSVLAARPKLATISTNALNHGGSFEIQLAAADTVGSVALIGLGNTTHGFDAGQRFQRLSFSQTGQTLRASLPGNANLTPPGYYQVVVVNGGGVPSRGVIVSVAAAAPQPVKAEAAPQAISLQASALPEYRVRHRNYLAFLDRVGPTSAALAKLDSAFYARAGLADKTCFSFESKNFPGYHLRHAGFRLRLDATQNTALYRADATFCRRPGLSGQGYSFESLNYPGRFLRHRAYEIWLDPKQADAAYNADASFNLVDAVP